MGGDRGDANPDRLSDPDTEALPECGRLASSKAVPRTGGRLCRVIDVEGAAGGTYGPGIDGIFEDLFFWGNSIALDLSFGFAAVKFSIFLLHESLFATSSLTLNCICGRTLLRLSNSGMANRFMKPTWDLARAMTDPVSGGATRDDGMLRSRSMFACRENSSIKMVAHRAEHSCFRACWMSAIREI